ncbi:MAG: sulfur carrier protein ThiS [Planctomycetota bacterium]|nr:sulfur carrier protein ThiS [Planctomycetota bacterium]
MDQIDQPAANEEQIEVHLNGEPQRLPVHCTVSALVGSLPVEPTAVAVERNRVIVPRSLHQETILESGDHIEIVTIVGGG